jgi:hypothetical protein
MRKAKNPIEGDMMTIMMQALERVQGQVQL